MAAHNYDELIAHVGHDIECVAYGGVESEYGPWNVAVECTTCNTVLLDFDHPGVSEVTEPQVERILGYMSDRVGRGEN